ncbi:MAG: dipeptidyl-peptidase 3 family protein, partial [Luteibaculum sp.]
MNKFYLLLIGAGLALASCTQSEPKSAEKPAEEKFEYLAEQFADLKIIRYKIPQWDSLDLRQKKLVYYLTQSGYVGRDIMWDQNYRHNLVIRKALEKIVTEHAGDDSEDWKNFMTYVKRVWFSNGIHHHYSTAKIIPEFSQAYFEKLLTETNQTLDAEVLKAIFDPNFDAKKVNLDPEKGLVEGSAINFYAPDVNAKEVEAFYAKMIDKSNPTPISYGLNSRIAKENGRLIEQVWRVGGMYGPALEQVVYWLDKAKGVAENEQQAKAIELLIEYYKTGDLKTWDDFNIAWVNDTLSEIDFIHGFVEVYNDPLGYRGSYETIIEIKDFEASARMSKLQEETQWFEDNSPIMDQHKKEKVKGVSYKVVNVAGEAGDASPSTPIGVNLPNANWIRANHGSKSVSLGNIVSAYEEAAGEGILEEFAFDSSEVALAKEYGKLGGKLHTALHEVVGHASGQLEPGVGTPKETLKNYSSTLEEGRADLVALYFLMDQKMVDLGLQPNLEVGKAEYQSYIRNGMMLQLRRLEIGDDVEEAHMRNRQWISKWVYEKGKADNVIEKVVKDGKTYFVIRDYQKLRMLFGELLKEVQRIKSQGDYMAAKALVEGYGVKVDMDLHKEVLDRAAKFESAP